MGDIDYKCCFESVWDTNLYYDNSYDSPNDLGVVTYFYYMLKEGKYTDVEFAVSNEIGSDYTIVSAHQLVLSMWSPYFADKFNGADENEENIISIKNVDPVAFEAMIKFMYGYFPSLKTCKETFEIFKVSEKFQVGYLMKVCTQRIKEIILEESNVFEILEAAIYMNITSLKESCLEFIQVKTIEVFNSCDIDKISESVIEKILDLRIFSLKSEYDLIKWIYLWAKNRYHSVSKYSSVREVLQDYLPKLYFASLTSQEFVRFFKTHETFFDQDEAFSILMNIAIPKSWPMPEWQDSDFHFRVYTGCKEFESTSETKIIADKNIAY